MINNSLVETYIYKIKFLNNFKSKPRYYLELLTFATVKVLRSKKRNVYKNIKTVKMYHLYELLKHYYTIVTSINIIQEFYIKFSR